MCISQEICQQTSEKPKIVVNNGMGQSTKLKRLRKTQCSAMRSKRWCGDKAQATTNTVQAQQKEQPPKGPVLRSSFPYKKVANVDLPYVVNNKLLVQSLQNCQHCRKGLLNLSKIREDVRSEAVWMVLKIRCSHCHVLYVCHVQRNKWSFSPKGGR